MGAVGHCQRAVPDAGGAYIAAPQGGEGDVREIDLLIGVGQARDGPAEGRRGVEQQCAARDRDRARARRPPLWISTLPPLSVAPASVPEDDTTSVPLETVVLEAVAPDRTSKNVPLATVYPVRMTPEPMASAPPTLIVVPISVPALSICSVPPLRTIVLEAVPPENTISLPPLDTTVLEVTPASTNSWPHSARPCRWRRRR